MLPLEMAEGCPTAGVRSVAFRTIFIFHLMELHVMFPQVVEPMKRIFANWAIIFVRFIRLFFFQR